MASRVRKRSKLTRVKVEVGTRTHKGMERPENQDSFGSPEGLQPELLQAKGRLYVIADGMGGHAAGQVAGQMAVQHVLQEYYEDPSVDISQKLVQAIEVANSAIYQHAQSPTYAGMGTTLVAAVLRGRELHVANVGDSRAYLVRGRRIEQITRDHSWVAAGLEKGFLNEDEARQHPRRNVVTRSLGTKPRVEIDIFQLGLQPGDSVLLCSDGLTGLVQDEEILKVIASRTPQEAANTLIDLANQRGGYDNVTALVINVTRVPGLVRSLRRFALPLAAGLAGAIIVVAAVRSQRRMWSPGKQPQGTATPLATASVEEASPMAPEMPPESTFTPPQGSIAYTVRLGDTLTSIAQQFGVTVEAIMEANDLPDPDRLEVGQILIIPIREATSPSIPSSIPTSTPLPTVRPSLASPTPTPATPVYKYPAPELISPVPWQKFREPNDEITFEWRSVAPLEDEEYYNLGWRRYSRGWYGTECHLLTKDRILVKPAGEWKEDPQQCHIVFASTYKWSVRVVKVEGGVVMRELSPPSASVFIWSY